MSKRVTDYTLYKWRYVLSYSVIGILLMAVVCIGTLYVPGELRQSEINSALVSDALSTQSLDAEMVVNFPYRILQRLSLAIFGVSAFAIKLPSIILGSLTTIGIFMLIRSWLKPSIAVISTVVLATSTHFLFMTQDGTPAITFCAIAIWLLVSGMYVTRGRYFHTFWKILGCALMAAALYVPLGVYLDIVVLITAFLHPHIRAIIKRLPKKKLAIGVAIGVVAMAPLVYALIIQPKTIGAALLGLPSQPGQFFSQLGALPGGELAQNAKISALALFGFAATNESYEGLLQPAYTLPLAAIALIGFVRLIATHYTARSYVVILLSIIIIPLALINPANINAIFVIMVIVSATGFDFLTNYWYRLFPRNPYARVAGLVPLCILVGGLVGINISQYFNGYSHNPAVMAAYNNDLGTVNQRLKDGPVTLVVNEDESSLYNLAARHNDSLTVLQNPSEDSTEILVTRAANRKFANWELQTIITNSRANAANRFYLYKKSQ